MPKQKPLPDMLYVVRDDAGDLCAYDEIDDIPEEFVQQEVATYDVNSLYRFAVTRSLEEGS